MRREEQAGVELATNGQGTFSLAHHEAAISIESAPRGATPRLSLFQWSPVMRAGVNARTFTLTRPPPRQTLGEHGQVGW
jgi:hypothetical protein